MRRAGSGRLFPGGATLFVVAAGLPLLPGCGVFALQRDHEAVVTKIAESDRANHDEIMKLHAELDATRDRLDNALRANADTGSDVLTEKSRVNELAGRLDETTHKLEELQSTLAAGRNELDARFDQLARAQAAQAAQQPVPAPAPPPTPIPAGKADHFLALEAAVKAKDYALVRMLGHEYVNRYATDEKADDALYLTGKADLDDARPASALGEWNRLLKLFPKSNMLEKTLFGMGEAYETMHDCANAKLAFGTVLSHFPHGKLATDARTHSAAISALPPGSCAPP
jgi:TolA-binding protein